MIYKREISRQLFFTSPLMMSMSVLAADLYVSPNGNDATNPGTSSDQAFATITKAAKAARPGTIVHVLEGKYYENVDTRTSGTGSAKIRFVSDKKWGAKIIGSTSDSTWLNKGSFVTIEGFDITGPGRIGIGNDGSYTLITGNHVHNISTSASCPSGGGAGIDNTNYAGSDGDIVGNVVHDIGVPGKCNGVQGDL